MSYTAATWDVVGIDFLVIIVGFDRGAKCRGRLFRYVLFSLGKRGNSLKGGADDSLQVAIHARRVGDHPVDLL